VEIDLKPDSFIGTINHDFFPSEIANHLYEVDRNVRAEKKVVFEHLLKRVR